MTNVNPENSTNQPAAEGQPAAGGLPLRGLAMVLIAVAVLLGLWGLYALTQGDDNGTTAASGNGTETAATAEQDTAAGDGNGDGDSATTGDGDGAGQEPGAPGSDEPASESRDDADGDDRDGADNPDAERDRRGDAEGERATREGAAAPAAPGRASGPAAEAETVVNVLNNSTVNGLAEDVYHRLEEKGTKVGEHGNLPGEVATLGETTLYYHPGDAAGERTARELGERIGDTNGVPVRIEPNIEDLPEETTGEGKITLVLIGEVVL